MNITYEQAKQADARGEKVEYRIPGRVCYLTDGFRKCTSDVTPEFIHSLRDDAEFRLADPYAELKAAHAAGKVIQVKQTDGAIEIWTDFYPQYESRFESRPADCYRVKPDAPTLEAGKEPVSEWELFTAEFFKREGFTPSRRDARINDLFWWFKAGAFFQGDARITDEPQPYDNWDKVPAWANWQAIDDCGFWRWFEQEPEKITPTHYFSVTGRMGGISSGTYPAPTNYTGTWEQSLQERPI
jgi:hypothetical protein